MKGMVEMMRSIPVPQQIYRHFKGNLYQIVTLAEHSESGEMMVVYQAMYGEFKVYTRPLSMFMEKVDKVKYPDAVQEYRFEQISTLSADRTTQPKELTAQPAELTAQSEDQTAEPEGLTAQPTDRIVQPADDEECGLDPLVLEFLDADTYEQRLNILAALHHRITDDMINTMAICIDVEVKEGDIEQRYEDLKSCLLLYDKFECNRMR